MVASVASPTPRATVHPPAPSTARRLPRPPVAPLARSVVRQIDGAVAAAIRDGETPGAVVAVVRPGGIAWKGAYGDR
ncbi:MAG: hypothetical protein AAF715_12345, partial [Myxococcota bacterium]